MIGPSDSADSEVNDDQPINPYQAPTSITPPGPGAQQRRPFATTWSGRRWLLQSVFFMRFSAIVSALLWGRSLLTWLKRPFDVYFEFGAEGLRSIILSPPILIQGLLAVATAIVCLYLNLVLWRYAQKVRDRAAGRESDDAGVCQTHLRFWKIYAVVMLLLVASDIAGYAFQWYDAAARNP